MGSEFNNIFSSPFKLHQIKITHYYFNHFVVETLSPVYTSVEIKCKFNYETYNLEWHKNIEHAYYGFNQTSPIINKTTTQINSNELINELNKIDLRKINNNFYTDLIPENYKRWEILYNDYFKIVGTYNNEINELKEIKKLIDFDNIVKNELIKMDESESNETN